MSARDDIRVGDTVFVGPEGDLTKKVTWKVYAIDQAAEGVIYARIFSGLTERRMTVPIERLTKFRVAEVAR